MKGGMYSCTLNQWRKQEKNACKHACMSKEKPQGLGPYEQGLRPTLPQKESQGKDPTPPPIQKRGSLSLSSFMKSSPLSLTFGSSPLSLASGQSPLSLACVQRAKLGLGGGKLYLTSL